MSFSWHWLWVLLLGYVIGYYFRMPGNMTVGKLVASSGA